MENITVSSITTPVDMKKKSNTRNADATTIKPKAPTSFISIVSFSLDSLFESALL